ncbi:hypothetical protein [Microvirga calopogonii]|uniref:hypothetical protein n=1 Tax=Microvirga calopogonii TaxID=2078013 RepID=UPI000E0DDF71|nr:hypothetical protein [Microvirga calopogonii]
MELGQLCFGNPTERFALDRETLSERFHDFLERIGLSIYGTSRWGKTFDTGSDHYATFRNDTFAIRPYYWGECTCGCNEEIGQPHSDDCALMLPNFEHFPSGLKVTWYKYALRGAFSNQELSDGEFNGIFASCLDSLGPDFDTGKPKTDISGEVLSVSSRNFARFVTLKTSTGQVRLHMSGTKPGTDLLVAGRKVAIATREGRPLPSIVFVEPVVEHSH